MDLLIKCSAASCDPCGVAAYGYTVRCSNRVVHQESGIVRPPDRAPHHAAQITAVGEALTWLAYLPWAPGQVVLRTTLPLPMLDATINQSLSIVQQFGWTVTFDQVAPEWVSEATALALRQLLAGPEQVPLPSFKRSRTSRQRRRRAMQTHFARTSSSPAASRPNVSDLILICDGGYKEYGQTGLSVYGCLARESAKLLHRANGVVCAGPAADPQTSELGAVLVALRWLARQRANPGTRIELRTDCEWVARMLGQQPIKRPHGKVMLLRAVLQHLSSLRKRGCEIKISRLPRKHVSEADSLCRQVYKRYTNAEPVRAHLSAFVRTTPKQDGPDSDRPASVKPLALLTSARPISC